MLDQLHDFAATRRPLPEPWGKAFSLESKVQEVLRRPRPASWCPTGVGREFYLEVAERIVRGAASWVNEEGRVLDPVRGQEMGQASPRFAAPGAVLLRFGRVGDLRATVFRCMDYCCRTLPSGQARKLSPDFWMRELATAFLALQGVVDGRTLHTWAKGLSAVIPEAIYTRVSPDGSRRATLGNWAIYAAAGEAMRERAELRPPGPCLWGYAFFDRYVGAQLGSLTSVGLYRDPGDPITYDMTTRLQIALGLVYGYAGPHREVLEELLRRGALTMLLYLSPEGYAPFGGRTEAFHLKEAIVSALCELEARRYREADPALAGAFKRQARRSALAVRRWLMDMEPWRCIKNGFEPAARHGFDSYGNYSGSSLLVASFFALAAVFADDSIPEGPCPAELGGYAFELAPAFHKVFANVRGTYLEIDTSADPDYDATGLGRFLVEGIPLELGLGMPFAAPKMKWNAPVVAMAPGVRQPDEPVAIGPAWESTGRWISLAGLSKGLRHEWSLEREEPDRVTFSVVYEAGTAKVSETYDLESGRVSIRSCVREGGRPVQRIRFVVPLLVTDGHTPTDIDALVERCVVTVRYRGHQYEVRWDPGVVAQVASEPYANRNGVYRSLCLESPTDHVRVTLELR